MAQYRKDEVEAKIVTAALSVFAKRGFQSAKMAEIAKSASVSIGNIYLYFPSKEELFQAVLPEKFVKELSGRMTRKVKAIGAVRDVSVLGPGAPYRVLSEELLGYWISNRERVVILLRGAQGTPYEEFAERAVERLVRLALEYLALVRPDVRATRVLRLALREIYRNVINAHANVIAVDHDERTIREVTTQLSAYHLAGIRHLFESNLPPLSTA